MRLRMQFPVACGAPVEITDSDAMVAGTVCSCVPENGAYLIGVRLSKHVEAAHGHAVAG